MSKEPKDQLAIVDTLRATLEKAAPRLAQVAPKHIKAERLIRLMLSACTRNPKLLQCSPESVLQFCMKCSETGLEPIGAGGAWAVPYENKKTGVVTMTFIPDFRGLINCAKRSECIKDAYAEAVYEKDEFDYELGLEPFLKHKPARGDRGALDATYCVVTLADDSKRFVVMHRNDVEAIRKRSRAANDGPWVTDEGEMWKKTVVRRAMKPYTGASQELGAALDADETMPPIDVTPIQMPKAVEGKAEAKAAPEPEPKKYPQRTIEIAVTGIRPKKATKEKPAHWMVDTHGEGVFETYSEKMAEGLAESCAKKELAAVTFEEREAAKVIL